MGDVPHDSRMRELRERPSFALEPRGVGLGVLSQELYGDELAVSDVARAIHVAHPASPCDLLDLEPIADDRPGSDGPFRCHGLRAERAETVAPPASSEIRESVWDSFVSMLHASPIVYAHRGASYELPENTLESFALALELGADAIETDAHMTRDGRIVLSHDASGERMAGVNRTIAQSALHEVQSWDVGRSFEPRRPGVFVPGRAYRMPTLDAALAAYPEVVFNIDAKQTVPDMMPALLRTIASARAEDRVRIASFSTRNLLRARQLGYPGETGLSANEIARLMFVPKAALRWLRVDGRAAQVPRRAYGVAFASQGAIDRFHAVGLRVDFWTIDDPAEAKRLFAMGADGVMTDDPRTMCTHLRSS
jgi:glycerophosphoryl diester phosphodiesterase